MHEGKTAKQKPSCYFVRFVVSVFCGLIFKLTLCRIVAQALLV